MARKATSIADVILGEATYGTEQERYDDMLSIASVISNRAALTGTTLEAVVAAPNQFQAYGKALPPGASKFQNLADAALAEVLEKGPVTNATYYATPAARSNLPNGLTDVHQTTGHVFAVDTQNRPIATTEGYIAPSAATVAEAPVPTPAPRGMDAIGFAPVTQEVPAMDAINAAMTTSAPAAPEMGGRTITPGLGLANLTPSVDYSPLAAPGKGRSMVPSSGIAEKVALAANAVVPGTTASVWSGQEPPGRAPVGAANRHPLGFAGDFDFYGPDDQRITDPVALHDIAMQMAADYDANIGYSQTGYMGPGRMHIDTMPLGQFPGGAQWGRTAQDWAGNLDFAREYNIGPTPYSNAPTPTDRPDPNEGWVAPAGLMASSLEAAPVGAVERAGTLAAAVPSVDTIAQAAPSARAAQEASMTSFAPAPAAPTAIDAISQVAPSTNIADVTQEVQAKAPSNVAAAYGQFADTMKAAGLGSVAGVAGKTAGQLKAADAVEYAGLTKAMAPANPVTAAVAHSVPTIAQQPAYVAPQAPVAMPAVAQPIAQVAQTTAKAQAPSTPSAPSGVQASYDFYGGKINNATSSTGAGLSRDVWGNTYNYSPEHDITTISNKQGDLAGTRSGRYTGNQTGKKAGGTSFGLNFGANPQMASEIGKLGGSVLGGLIAGPIGSAIGAKLGQKFAQSQFGPVPMAPNISLADFNRSMQSYQAGHAFPDAPSAPSGGGAWGGWADGSGPGSRDFAESISPGAADAIDAGSAGLY